MRNVKINLKLIKLNRLFPQSREDRLKFIQSRYHPEEYNKTLETSEEHISNPMAEVSTNLIHSTETARIKPFDNCNVDNLIQFLRQETDFQQFDFIKVPKDRGMPFSQMLALPFAHRRVRIAIAEALAYAFRKSGPVVDGLPKKMSPKSRPEEAEWIAVNIPGVALVHLMDPKTMNEIDLAALWRQEQTRSLPIDDDLSSIPPVSIAGNPNKRIF